MKVGLPHIVTTLDGFHCIGVQAQTKPTSCFMFIASSTPHGGNSVATQSATSSDDQVAMKAP